MALLAAFGRTLESLPADIVAAVNSGKISVELLKRYLEGSANWALSPLYALTGFRERLIADPNFLTKVAIECGIGIFTKGTAEYARRGDNFSKELDFVTANVIMAIIADFMLVWLPAPTFAPARMAAANAAQKGAVAKFFATCPDNAFQVVPYGAEPWTVAQRAAAVARNGAKLIGVGITASMIGVGLTNAMIAFRKQIDPSFETLNPPQNPLKTSAVYGLYMGSSSNFRYQLLAGVVEERFVDRVFRNQALVASTLSFILRTGNTFLGSLLWVDFVRLFGMQKVSHASRPPGGRSGSGGAGARALPACTGPTPSPAPSCPQAKVEEPKGKGKGKGKK